MSINPLQTEQQQDAEISANRSLIYPRGSYLNFAWAVPSRPSRIARQRRISVVLPVYNQGRYLKASIESILRDHRTPLELLVIDDGSTDDTPRILEQFSRDDRVKVVRQQNRGLSHALNRGFEDAQGDYLTWTSADNRFLPGALERMADFLTLNPAIAFVYANVELIGEDDRPLPASGYRVANQRSGQTSVLDLPASADTLLRYNDNFVNACFLFRSALRSAVGGFDQSKNGYEDYDFWVRAQLFGTFAHFDSAEPLYEYRLHAESLTGRLNIGGLHQSQQLSLLDVASREAAAEKLSFEIACAEGSSEELLTLVDLIGPGIRRSAALAKPTFAEVSIPRFNTSTVFETVVERLDFMHSGLTRYQKGRLFRARRRADAGVHGELLVMPPVDFPRLLRRARDGSLGAVVRNPDTRCAVLVFVPDQSSRHAAVLSRMKELVEGNPTVLWVAFCHGSADRSFADSLNLALAGNSNYRIIDSSGEPCHGWKEPQSEHFSTEPWQERSLLYALSGVDAIVSFKHELDRIGSLLELRCESALAAAAGIPILAISKEQDRTGSKSASQVFSLVSDCPHLSWDFTGSSSVRLLEVLIEMKEEFDLRSAEQWLEMQSGSVAARRIRAVMLAG